MNMMRLSICLLLGLASGLFCAYGTINAGIPGLALTNLVLLSVIYNRILIGFFIGIIEDVCLVKGGWQNSLLRGALMGGIISLAIALPGGMSAYPLVLFGAAYGMVMDIAASVLAPRQEPECLPAGKGRKGTGKRK
jgi:hypothetical protein